MPGAEKVNADPTILILEDERPQILALRATLQPIGRVIDFSDPQLALDYLKDQEVDAAVVDVHMPRMPLNGVEFIRAVRTFDKHVAIIIRTGDASIEIAEHAIELQAFRRVIKSKTSVHELRELLRAGIAETRTRRQLSRDAASTAGVAQQLEETLGTIEDELTAAECYKAMLHTLRNQLTAVAGFAEVWSALVNHTRRSALSDAAAENNRIVSRILADIDAFLDGPFAEVHPVPAGNARADVNGTLDALRKRFLAATRWAAEQKSVAISVLPQPLLVDASPIRLLTVLRHITEFCFLSSPPEARVVLVASYIPTLDKHLSENHGPCIVFNRPERSSALGHVCFHWQAGPVSRNLEQIRQQFHAQPDDARTGNLHMIGLNLGEAKCAVLVRVSNDKFLSFQLFVPTAE